MTNSIPSLCFFMALLLGCRPECDLPPKDHPLVATSFECAKDTGKDPLCLGKCIVETLEVVKDGTVNKTRITEIIDDLEEGQSKDAAKTVTQKCVKDGAKIDVKQSHCMGYLRIAKCIRGVLKKKCPELLNAWGV